MARLSGKSRGTTALALLASTALLAGLIVGPGAVASGGDGATTAAKKKKKKRCKPGFRKVVIKKKGKKRRVCRKIPGPPPGPRVRATISWSGGADSDDFDLFVFDASGNRARATNNTIPNSAMTGNAKGAEGTESFTDTIFVTGATTNRNFSFGICKIDGSNSGTAVRIEYVTADGVTHTDTTVPADTGSDVQYNNGPAFPPTFDNLCNFLP